MGRPPTLSERRSPRELLTGLAAALLAACAPTERLVGVDGEAEANRLAVALAANGVVDVTVQPASGGQGLELRVPPADLFDARRVLDAVGLPDGAADPGALDTPSFLPDASREAFRQARIQAHELEEALALLPDVAQARVHLAAAPRSPFATGPGENPGSVTGASVLLTHRADLDPDDASFTEGVAEYVASAIAGLEADRVEVLARPATVETDELPGGLSEARRALRDRRASEASGVAALRARFLPLYALAAITSLLSIALALDRIRNRSRR